MKTRAWVGATLLVSALATAPSALAQDPIGEQCPPRNGQTIVITAGDIDCITASDYAAKYNPMGDKYQAIPPFTCYSGTAMTAPLLFQCVADVEGPTEFSVYPG